LHILVPTTGRTLLFYVTHFSKNVRQATRRNNATFVAGLECSILSIKTKDVKQIFICMLEQQQENHIFSSETIKYVKLNTLVTLDRLIVSIHVEISEL